MKSRRGRRRLRGGTEKRVSKRLGDLVSLKNLAKKPAAADKYNHIRVQFPDGEEKHLLFTDHEIKVALDRADKNPEDLPQVGWLRDLFD